MIDQTAPEPYRSSGKGVPGTPPNIVFILADDLGWADLGCFGSPHIKTPNIDALASGGVRFTHAYSGSPWCSPARISLYTGRHPSRLPVGLSEPLQVRNEQNGIPDDHPTLASLLVDAGYSTAMFGKWHCGWLPWFHPTRNGFQTFWGNLDGGVDYLAHVDTLGQPDLYDGETPIEMDGYYTDLISEKTAEYIARSGDQPFYTQVNYTAPHWPWEGREDHEASQLIVDDYASGKIPMALSHRSGGSLATYTEMVQEMDAGIGVITDSLRAAGKFENTIIIFTSDNGGERWSMNWPFVGEKGDLNEGGIRVPTVLSWPDRVNGGQVSDDISITMDWTVSLLAAAGAAPASSHPMDGVDLMPWLVGDADHPGHDLYWRTGSQGAMRRGRYKYLRDLRDRPASTAWPRAYGTYDLLYDVTVDGREAAEISRHHPELVAEMSAAWDDYNAELLPYPEGQRHLPPGYAGHDRPAISVPD